MHPRSSQKSSDVLTSVASSSLTSTQLHSLLAGISDALTVLDNEWRYTYVNPRAAELSGLPADQMIGRTMWELFPAVVGTEMERRCRNAVITRTTHSSEFYYQPLKKWFELRIYPTEDATVIIFADITERKTQEFALTVNKERFRTMAESMPQIVWTAAPDGAITYINRHWEEFTGVPADKINDHEAIESVFHPDDAARVFPLWAERLRTGTNHEVEWRFRKKSDGRFYWFLTRALPVREADGQIREWFGTATNIDDHKRAAEAVSESEQRYRQLSEELQLITDTVGTSLVRCDHMMRYVWVNRAYADLYGMPQEQFPGRLLKDIMQEHAFDRVLPQLQKVLNGERVQYETQVCYPAAGERWIQANLRPTHNASGAVDGWVGSIVDITTSKKAETALREADRRKDEFIAMLGHELRNPLGPILNASHALKPLEANVETRERLRSMIERQATHMARLTDDLLDVSRISRGKILLRREPLDLAMLVRGTCDDYRNAFDARQVALQVYLPEENLWASLDRTRVAQCIGNLLHNALKFTADGGRVDVTLSRPSAGGEAAVEVTDNGAGIPPDVLPRLFQPFAQGEQPMDRASGGLGLGLALVKGLVELHGGRAEARSAGKGKGATFTLHLPLSHTPPSSLMKAVPVETQPKHILIIEDNADAAESLQLLLSLAGHEVKVALTAAAGIGIALAARPDIVICDIGLPDRSGYDVARELRPKLPTSRLVALTGYGQDDDQRKARESGFDLHLTKPVEPEALERLVAGI